ERAIVTLGRNGRRGVSQPEQAHGKSGPMRSAASSCAALVAVLALAASGCGGAKNEGFRPPVPPSTVRAEQAGAGPDGDLGFAREARAPRAAPDQIGKATWYGKKFTGKKTASGERFDHRL